MLKITDLRVNDRIRPLGIAGDAYLSWRYESDERNVTQETYAITVKEKDSGSVVWNSGTVSSRQQAFVEIETKLRSKQEYAAHVTATDNHGNTAQADTLFETALYPEEITACWVESTIPRQPMSEYKYGIAATPVLFEKEITLPDGITKARLYATAFGVYEARINGQAADDRRFAPEFTAAKHLQYYQTYDVTGLLHAGKNTLSLYVADGWDLSDQARPVETEDRQNHAVLYELHVWSDGKETVFFSDGTETVRTGSIVYSDLDQGEAEDLTRPDGERHPVKVIEADRHILCPQPMDAVRVIRELPAVKVFTSPKGETIVDFGQVLTGLARVQIREPAGSKITLDYFEVLDTDGNYINTMFAPQRDTFVTDGWIHSYEAKFTFHGFRYIRVEGIKEVKAEDFTALLLSTQKEELSSFETDDPLINRLYQNIRWSQWNNMLSVPTDCPTREKAGWTGDIHVYADTALANENVTPFLTGWLMNVLADENGSGVIKIVSPYMKLYTKLFTEQARKNGKEDGNNVAGWSDAIVFVPWSVYRSTGNQKILQMCWPVIERFCENLMEEIGEDHMSRLGFHFGEWLIPSEPSAGFDVCKKSALYIAPFFDCQSFLCASEIAEAIGRKEQAKRYRAEYEQMRSAIMENLIVPEKLPHLMGAYVLALAFDYVPEHLKEHYKQKLLSILAEKDNCLDTGFLATPYILQVLSSIGETKKAHDLLFQDKRPSWLYEVKQGATTIWEAWDADDARKGGRFVSFDHYAFGCVDDFLRGHICGITSNTPGWDHVRIAPERNDRIRHFTRTLRTVHGLLTVAYERTEGKETLKVTVPPNSTATVVFHGEEKEIGSGSYVFCA